MHLLSCRVLHTPTHKTQQPVTQLCKQADGRKQKAEHPRVRMHPSVQSACRVRDPHIHFSWCSFLCLNLAAPFAGASISSKAKRMPVFAVPLLVPRSAFLLAAI